MFRPLRSRDDLLALVKAHAPTKACASAIEQGRAIVVGGFTHPDGRSSYVVHVRAKYEQAWTICVTVYEVDRRHLVTAVDTVVMPWKCWDGVLGGKRPLIDGDQHKPEWKELYAQRTPQKTPVA